jgi:uncharacterized membrane protein YbhN (UPF0104 family)
MDRTDSTKTDVIALGRTYVSALRLFAAPPGSPRAQRPTDVVLLIISLFWLVVTTLTADPPGRLSSDISRLVQDSPEWLISIWEIGNELVVWWAIALVVLAVLRRHILLAAMALCSAVTGLIIAFICHRLAMSAPLEFTEYVEAWTRNEAPPVFPAIRLVTAGAVIVVASPAVARPVRFFGRIVILMAFLSVVGLETSNAGGAIAGLAAAISAAAVVHLVFGSPGGRPSIEMAEHALAELGAPVHDLHPARLEPAGVIVLDGTDEIGHAVTVKVYGRDAWDGQLLAKLWRAAWYREDGGPVLFSRLHQVEHEALLTVLAQRSGAPAPKVLTAGATEGSDAILVVTADGVAVDTLTERSVPEDSLATLWAEIDQLHRDGIVHGSLDAHRLLLADDDALLLIDWSTASTASAKPAILAERAQLLAVTAMLIGSDRAISIAVDQLGKPALGDLMPYLQGPALTSGLRRDLHAADFDLDELREQATEVAEIEAVELVKLRRVTVGSVATMALLMLAAWMLISGLADIGLDTIVDELSQASWGWVLAALVAGQVARVFSGVGTTGATNHPLRLGPTVMLEFAITFINLAVPSSAARFATKMRYFQKVGMSLTSATSMSVLDSVAVFTVQIGILIVGFLFGVGALDLNLDLDEENVKRLVLIVVAIIVVVIAVTMIVPSLRKRVIPPLREMRVALRVLRSPGRLLRLLGGNFMSELTFAIVLGLSLFAYGESAPLLSLMVVNTMVALFAGLMPVPGGIGITEAALTAGLMAIGVPEGAAFAAAITTRLCTFYLPPIWGYFAMRWMRNNSYL